SYSVRLLKRMSNSPFDPLEPFSVVMVRNSSRYWPLAANAGAGIGMQNVTIGADSIANVAERLMDRRQILLTCAQFRRCENNWQVARRPIGNSMLKLPWADTGARAGTQREPVTSRGVPFRFGGVGASHRGAPRPAEGHALARNVSHGVR